jgi:hypothetical protein
MIFSDWTTQVFIGNWTVVSAHKPSQVNSKTGDWIYIPYAPRCVGMNIGIYRKSVLTNFKHFYVLQLMPLLPALRCHKRVMLSFSIQYHFIGVRFHPSYFATKRCIRKPVPGTEFRRFSHCLSCHSCTFYKFHATFKVSNTFFRFTVTCVDLEKFDRYKSRFKLSI